jgi:light-regulated signal transduction histidine kinase (bacteriophytochrome)
VDGAKRMQVLIDDLLTFSRVGQKDVPFVVVDLNVICKKILEDLDALIKENQATIQFGALPILNANETQMTQLFLNLISNAIKYRAERPPIVKIFSKQIETNQWQLTVSDNGIGIEEKYFDKLFVIFKRLHTRRKYKGTGIGLALCKKIVENYDGHIWIESKFNEGTTFHFILKGRV